MNLTGRLRLAAALASLLSFHAFEPSALAREPRAIDERGAIETSIVGSPALRGAAIEAESAAVSLEGSEAQNPFTLILDGAAIRTQTPQLSREPGMAPVNTSHAVQVGAELRKRTLLGTELSLRLDGSWRFNTGPVFAGLNPLELGPGYGVGLRFAAIQPLLRNAGVELNEAPIVQAEARQEQADRARDRAASEVVRGVIGAYWELWFAGAASSIQGQSLALATRQRDEAKGRAEIGTAAPADVLSFETRLATRNEELVAAELEVERRANELARVMGDSSSSWRAAEGVPPMPPELPDDAIERALAESLELKEAVAAVKLAEANAVTTETPLRARLDLDASVEARGLGVQEVSPAFEQLGTLGALSARVGLTYEQPLDGTQLRAAAARARLAVEAAEARVEEVKRRIEAEVSSELAREQAARRRLELAQQTAEIAGRQVELERARYAAGASTPIQLLEAEEAQRTARLRVARARVDLVSAHTSVLHAMGLLLDDKRVRLDAAGRMKSGRLPLGLIGRF